MKDYYIKTKDLSVGYQGKVLIRDINLDIKKGEIVTLIGPNGAGKSTILKSVTRQLKLIGGEVYLSRCSGDRALSVYRKIGSPFQGRRKQGG